MLSVPPELIGSSPQMAKIRDVIEKLRASSISVLIEGESGTGKSFAARLLSGSKDPFIWFNCGSLSDDIATWQLLGIPKGIPGGPSEGILSKAAGGILFLDEVEMLSPKTQMLLLAALQERSFQPPGNSRRRRLNVRFVSATALDLKKLVEKGTFQPDLYHHLSGAIINMPALRTHREDIPEFVDCFVRAHAKQFGKDPEFFQIAPSCYEALKNYDWPGNVRELDNVVHLLLIMTHESGKISEKCLSDTLFWTPSRRPSAASASRIFLRHSSADKTSVRGLHEKLRRRGLRPWLDEVDLLPGQDWQAEITKAVRASNIVLVCVSRNSVTKEGFVQKEIRIALDVADEKPDGQIFIIPARLEECDVPQRLRRWQWVDLFKMDGFEQLMRALTANAGATK